jgi:hypothetical protein
MSTSVYCMGSHGQEAHVVLPHWGAKFPFLENSEPGSFNQIREILQRHKKSK